MGTRRGTRGLQNVLAALFACRVCV
jgi:hypothetical protein